MDRKTDIIIFGGQSNMQGQSETLSNSRAVENAYEYKWLDDSLVPLANPVGENITYDKTAGDTITPDCHLGEWLKKHAVGGACYGHTNLVPEFCRAYNAQTGTDVIAVHVAKGSTEIADWLSGTPGFDIITAKASAAIEKAEAERRVGRIFFVWLQGESDAISGRSCSYYKKKLTELNASLKDSLHIEKFGIIRVGRFTEDARDDEIITAQDEICRENDDFLMLTDIAAKLNGEPEHMHPHIPGHFSAKGLEKLGKTAGETLGNYTTQKF